MKKIIMITSNPEEYETLDMFKKLVFYFEDEPTPGYRTQKVKKFNEILTKAKRDFVANNQATFSQYPFLEESLLNCVRDMTPTHLLDESLQVSNKPDGTPDYEKGDGCTLFVMHCYRFNSATARAIIKERQSYGEQYWWYTCTRNSPALSYYVESKTMNMRLQGWQQFEYDLSGIIVWYSGEEDSSTYVYGTPGLLFCVYQNKNIILKSDRSILSGLDMNYINERCKRISRQMGFGYAYDNTIDTPIVKGESEELCDKAEKYNLNKCGKLYLRARVKTQIKKMSDGYLIDLGDEYVGFLDMDFISDSVQDIKVAYAEHIVTGDVEWQIGKCDYSMDFKAREGRNVFLNTFRRFACRYIRVFSKEIQINYIGIRPVQRQIIEIKRTFKDNLLQRIYDASVATLKGCMHEHYEDGPFREQAMYIYDTRNQMLFGYSAFKGFSFARENLLFIAKGQKEDGIMPITSPTSINLPIPLFSLMYVLMVYEYIKYSGDLSVYNEIKDVLKKIMEAFTSRVEENGLIAQFPFPYWNYYDWNVDVPNLGNYAQILRKETDPYEKKYDVILNCAYILACRWYGEISGENIDTKKTEEAVKKHFFDEEKGLFTLEEGTQLYTRLGNSLAMLAGLADEKVAEKMVLEEDVIDVSLSMNPFCYDALLQFGDKYKEYILNEIKRKFGKMLDAGFNVCWETDGGPEEAGNTMLHAWSSFPAHYLPIYFSDK